MMSSHDMQEAQADMLLGLYVAGLRTQGRLPGEELELEPVMGELRKDMERLIEQWKAFKGTVIIMPSEDIVP